MTRVARDALLESCDEAAARALPCLLKDCDKRAARVAAIKARGEEGFHLGLIGPCANCLRRPAVAAQMRALLEKERNLHEQAVEYGEQMHRELIEARALVERAVAEERARCMADVCDHCAEGREMEPVGNTYHRWRGGRDYLTALCKAHAIRARGEKETT